MSDGWSFAAGQRNLSDHDERKKAEKGDSVLFAPLFHLDELILKPGGKERYPLYQKCQEQVICHRRFSSDPRGMRRPPEIHQASFSCQ